MTESKDGANIGKPQNADDYEKATRYKLIEYCAGGNSNTCLAFLANYCSTRFYPRRLDFNAYSVKEHPTEDLSALTPLTAACGLTLTGSFARRSEEDKRLEIVKKLLQYHTDPNFQPTGSSFWNTPLMIAAWIGYEKITELLLRYGAAINCSDRHNSTALIYAAGQGHKKIVEQLLEAGADPEIINSRGWSAIHYAVAKAYIGIIRILMKKQGITPEELGLIEKSVFQKTNVKIVSPTIVQNTYPAPG
ncbi:MAG: ankyrin repeat domain-containing protein [Patescibacteria group bacterium]|jgi:hypothetical protein